MKVCCISDIHGYLPEIPPCDLLLVAGDIVPLNIQRDINASEKWINSNFKHWLTEIQDRGTKIFSIWGNHDFIGEAKPSLNRDVFLIDEIAIFNGLKIYGTPYQQWYGGWAFNLKDNELKKVYKMIQEDTDILLIHAPPFGILDSVESVYGGVEIIEHCGSPIVLEEILKLKQLKICVFGHIHYSYGVKKINDTVFVNASICNENYKPVNKHIIVEI